MKRIVDGVTYNTETSTRLAQSVWKDGDGDEVTGTLYQTRGGAFFVHEYATKDVWIERLSETVERDRNEIIPMSSSEAQEWIMTGQVDVYSNPFDDPPEAAAEVESGATIYIRVPASLKRRVDEASQEAKVSGNVWAMRCVERCLEKKTIDDFKPLALIFDIAATAARIEVMPKAKYHDALVKITDLADELAKELGVSFVDLAVPSPDLEIALEEVRREFMPRE